jgi:hypothetical protein
MWDRCGHCGREGSLERAGDVQLSGQMLDFSTPDGLEEIERQVRAVVLRCTRCDGVTLLQYTYWDGQSDPTDFTGLHRVYPEARDVDDLPKRVRDRYAKMLELMYEPDAFAMRAGKVLEAICNDHGYAKGDLGPRLDQSRAPSARHSFAA